MKKCAESGLRAAFGPAAGAGSGRRPGPRGEPAPPSRRPPTRCGRLPGLPRRFRPRRGRRWPQSPKARAPQTWPANGAPTRRWGPGLLETQQAPSPALCRAASFDENVWFNIKSELGKSRAISPSPKTSFPLFHRWLPTRPGDVRPPLLMHRHSLPQLLSLFHLGWTSS